MRRIYLTLKSTPLVFPVPCFKAPFFTLGAMSCEDATIRFFCCAFAYCTGRGTPSQICVSQRILFDDQRGARIQSAQYNRIDDSILSRAQKVLECSRGCTPLKLMRRISLTSKSTPLMFLAPSFKAAFFTLGALSCKDATIRVFVALFPVELGFCGTLPQSCVSQSIPFYDRRGVRI